MYHTLDIKPIPKAEMPLYINEPWLMDPSNEYQIKEPDQEDDNIRVYVPLDLNKEAILRRLDYFIDLFGEATEENEVSYQYAVLRIISQLEIYDQIWLVRDSDWKTDENGMTYGHSKKAVKLAKEIIDKLENIPDGCAECFPFDLISKLENEYLNE